MKNKQSKTKQNEKQKQKQKQKQNKTKNKNKKHKQKTKNTPQATSLTWVHYDTSVIHTYTFSSLFGTKKICRVGMTKLQLGWAVRKYQWYKYFPTQMLELRATASMQRRL